MAIPEIMREIKQNHTEELLAAITQRDKSGKGYICPLCGSGSGSHGTGISQWKNGKDPYLLQCFNCGFKGDALDLLQATEHLPDAKSTIERAESILHRQFLNNDNNVDYKPKKQEVKEKENKNMSENKDNLNVLEQFKEREKRNQLRANLSAYMAESKNALPLSEAGMQYLKRRGISEQTAAKFNLGFVDHYPDGMNTGAIIIPTGKLSYTARSIATDEGGRKIRKRNATNKQGIFNIEQLKNPGAAIFIVEGEFDALSLLEIGFNAIATGGGTSETELIEVIKKSKSRPESFVILPDNDRNPDGTANEAKGFTKGLKLQAALEAAKINSVMIDTRQWPTSVKDVNDFLIKDRQGLTKLLFDITSPIVAKSNMKLGRAADYVQSFIDHISGKTAPISTGFKKLDLLLDGGLHPGLIIVGAISSLGKTTFVLNIADNMATRGQDVILFSLEMSKFELMAKSISRKTFLYCKANKRPTKYAKTNLGITDFDRYQTSFAPDGTLKQGYCEEELNIISECTEDYLQNTAGHFYVVEGVGNIGTAEIRERVEKFVDATGRTPVIIIDYIQILAPENEHGTDKQNTDKSVVELKRLSRDLNTPVIGISSFNRDNYKEPVNMAAFKESGAIEYTSDILLGLQYHGMDYQAYTGPQGGQNFETEKDKNRIARIAKLFEEVKRASNAGEPLDIDVKVLKNRSGKKGEIVLQYIPRFNCYMEE